jgi:hypothetical protein
MSYAATIQQLKKEILARQAAITALEVAIGSTESEPAPARAPKAERPTKRPRKVKAERKAKRTRPARVADDDILATLDLSVPEAAKKLGVSSQTIYKRRAAFDAATEAAVVRSSGDGQGTHDPFRVE